jgi:hypothetical protein
MKMKNIIIAISVILLIGASTALAFNLSKKQPEPEIGSYSGEFVAQYVKEKKADEVSDEMFIPRFSENELIFDNQGCFWLGRDAGSNSASGF